MKRRVVILALATALCGLVVAVWLPNRVQRATLADGTELTLAAVTFGKEHRYVSGGLPGRLRAWLAKALRPLKLNFKAPPGALRGTDNDAVTFWFKVRLPMPGHNPYLSFCVVDKLGTGNTRPAQFPVLSLSPTDQVASVTFETFPRSTPELEVQAFSYASPDLAAQPLSSFHAANRRFSRRSPWQASPLPILVRNDGIDFLLERLVTGVSSSGNGNRAANPRSAATLAQFRITEGGRTSTNWQPVGITASDAAGDRPQFHNWRPLAVSAAGDVGMIFQDALWAEEPAWKLRVEFTRTAGFAPEELWQSSIPAAVTGNHDERSAPHKTFDSGSTVSVLGLQPGDQPAVGRLLQIRITPEPRDFRLTVVNVTDERGQSLKADPFSSTSGNGKADYYFNLQGVGDTGTLNLTLGLPKSRFIEYTAKSEPVK